MWKVMSVVTSLLIVGTLSGCDKETTQLRYEELSEKEQVLLNLTGNQVFLYQIENMPKDRAYELSMTYEVYQDGEKIKEALLMSALEDEPSSTTVKEEIGVNIEENKIITLFRNNGCTATNVYHFEETINEFSRGFFTSEMEFSIGTQAYIFYATSNKAISSNLPLGVPIDSDLLNRISNERGTTILIKLSFEPR